jgi:hypothetical protein
MSSSSSDSTGVRKGVERDALRTLVRAVLLETVSMFEEWMSPDVMDVLIGEYASSSPSFGTLKWEYAPLPARVWGEFVAEREKLYVNRYKTRGLFSQQVETILHEIQHWNQFLKVAEEAKITNHYQAVLEFSRQYKAESARRGYHNNRFEVDARAFSERYLEAAITKLSKHYGGKVEGGTFDQAVEEIFDEFSDAPFVTRAQIGAALKAHDANSPENMKKAVAMLSDLGMKVR